MKYISNLIFILFFISSIFPQNILSFEYTGSDSLKINLSNTDEVGGFQFLIDGINFLSASGGVAESNDFNISVSGSTVIGFSMTGATIPSGENHLTTLFLDTLSVNLNNICFNDENPCQSGTGSGPCCRLSDPIGGSLDLILGECVEGCLDNLACNSLTAEDCIYAMTYYQDIDNDSMGNGLISQMYCDDEVPESGWVLGPDNGGNPFDSDGGEECPEDTPADCSGVCGGDSIVDECDICGGNGSEENYDCDGNCLSTIDECGECGGSGPEENYDCDGGCTQLLDLNGVCCDFSDADCSGICAGTEIDEDEDGICDNVDTCIEETGVSQECGCNAGVAEGSCDCDGNVLDACGVCGGSGADEDEDGICDDVDTCIEETGASQECGCNVGVAEGSCDCDGNVLDACGVCGGEGTSCLSAEASKIGKMSIIKLYPNPFNPRINIEYSVAIPGVVSLNIIGIDGQIISTLINRFQANGSYNTSWSPKNISSGVYLLQLESNKTIYHKKIIYLK